MVPWPRSTIPLGVVAGLPFELGLPAAVVGAVESAALAAIAVCSPLSI